MKTYLHPIEQAGEKELQALQLDRLKETLNHAYSSNAFWKNKFDAHGVAPSDLQTLADLSKFPFMVKDEIRQHYPFGLYCVPMDRITRVHASSGTTGSPTVVGYTRRDLDDWADVVARSIFAGGGRPGDIVQVSYGYGLFTGGLGAHYGAERLGCVVVPLSGGQTERQVKLLKDFGASVIMVTPSYLLTIADAMDRLGVTPDQLKLKTGILGAEPWTLAMRQEIEQRLNINALDIYGLSEVIGPGVGQELQENKGKTVLWEDYFYPEIIDPDGNVLPPGEEGELVFTSLRKQAMPVIRYRTRDLTRLYPPEGGRAMRSMDRILGRNDDMMIVKGVNVYPTQIEELIMTTEALSPHYLLELCKETAGNTLTVKVEASDQGSDTETVKQTLRDKIKTYVGINCAIEIVPPNSLPRSEGKAKRIQVT